MDGIWAGQLSGKLGGPALGHGALTKRAALTSECGGKDAAVVFELVWMVRIRRNVAAEGGSIRSGGAREGAGLNPT